jgi:uncharacterized protein
MVVIEFREYKEMDLKGSTIIEGFPGVGLVSTICATYLIDTLKLDQICAVESEDFPPTSMIYATKPKFPARIYASAEKKLAVFLGEFSPSPNLHRPIAMKLLDWVKEKECARVVSTEGLPSTEVCKHETNEAREPNMFGVGSTDNARAELKTAGIEQLEVGMVYGISGVLLNEGRWQDYDTMTLLAEACPHVPDAMATTKILEALNKLMPDLKIDIKPLLEQSSKFEEHLKGLREQAKPSMPEPYKMMYG